MVNKIIFHDRCTILYNTSSIYCIMYPPPQVPCFSFLFHQGWVLNRRSRGAEPQLTHTGYICRCNHWGFATMGKTSLRWLREPLTFIPSTSLLTFNLSSQLTPSSKFSSAALLITTPPSPQPTYTQSRHRWVGCFLLGHYAFTGPLWQLRLSAL